MKKDPKSLTEYVKEKKRAECIVCQLSDDVREQLAGATKKKIRRADQIEWLRDEVGVDISDSDLQSHYSGKHML